VFAVPTLYVTQPGATVRNQADCLVVTEDEYSRQKSNAAHRRKVLLTVQPHRLELVALLGRVHITSSAVLFCLDRGIAVAWLTASGNLRGRLTPAVPRSADLRLAQYAAWNDTAVRYQRARNIVVAKMLNATHVLEQIQSNYPGREGIASAIAEVKQLAARAQVASRRDELLGLEGRGAAVYFQAYGSAFRGDITFTGRHRRPPPDPANAMLSFGYVMLGNVIASIAEARGFDPALGFLHDPQPGRSSLALDLLEELRHPIVDRFVLRECNLRVIRPEMFEPDSLRPGGVCLTREGLKRFLREWENFLLRPVPEHGSEERLPVLPLVQRQVDRLAADLRGQAAYQSFECDG
jgi:CRISPR-associated protein Cas1